MAEKRCEGEMHEYRLGIHLGYPECCVSYFIKTCGAIGNPVDASIHKYHGFLPCVDCANKIRRGETTLEGLITNRAHPQTFPNDSLLMNEEFFENLLKKWNGK